MSNRQTRRAMQGGEIEGREQRLLKKQIRALLKAVRGIMKSHSGIPAEHQAQEEASIIVQALLAEVMDPMAFFEGALTQMGWQACVLSDDAREVNADCCAHWFANGYNSGLLEPIAMPPEGSA